MKSFEYTIQNPAGIHARPAGTLVRTAERFNSDITAEKDNKKVSLKKLIELMRMSAAQNDTLRIFIDGEDEIEAFEAMKAVFEENL